MDERWNDVSLGFRIAVQADLSNLRMVLDSGNQVALVTVRVTRDDQCLEPGDQRQQKLKDGRKIGVPVGILPRVLKGVLPRVIPRVLR